MMGEPSTEPFGSPKRICPRRPERSRSLRNLGETCKHSTVLFKTEAFGSPRRICPGEAETPRNWKNLGGTLMHTCWNLGGTLAEPSALKGQKHHETCPSLVHPWWRNLGKTFHGTFWRPKTDLLQRTIKSPKGIRPQNLYYGLRPQSIAVGKK